MALSSKPTCTFFARASLRRVVRHCGFDTLGQNYTGRPLNAVSDSDSLKTICNIDIWLSTHGQSS